MYVYNGRMNLASPNLKLSHQEPDTTLDDAKRLLIFIQKYNLFGELLAIIINGSTLSAAQLASNLSVTSAAVTQWKNGKRLPDSGQVYKIEKALNLSTIDEEALITAWTSTRFFRGYELYLKEAISEKDLIACKAILMETVREAGGR